MVIETINENRYIVVGYRIMETHDWVKLFNYTEDLKIIIDDENEFDFDDGWDIMKVYSPVESSCIDKVEQYGELLWKRMKKFT